MIFHPLFMSIYGVLLQKQHSTKAIFAASFRRRSLWILHIGLMRFPHLAKTQSSQ